MMSQRIVKKLKKTNQMKRKVMMKKLSKSNRSRPRMKVKKRFQILCQPQAQLGMNLVLAQTKVTKSIKSSKVQRNCKS